MKNQFAYFESLVLEKDGKYVSIESKRKTVSRYGRNTSLASGVAQMVWATGGIETLPTDNLITHFASDDAGDDQDLLVEGYTIDGNGNLTFVSQTVTLNGTTKTALNTDLARISHVENMGSTSIAGSVSFSKDVTYTSGVPASDVHYTLNSFDKGEKSVISTASDEYLFITSLQFSVLGSVSANINFDVEISVLGGLFKKSFSVSTTDTAGTFEKDFGNVPLIVPPNSDVRIIATSSENSSQASVFIEGLFASVIR